MGSLLEEQGRALRSQHAVADFCHFKGRRDGMLNALEVAGLLKLADEVAQITVFQEALPLVLFYICWTPLRLTSRFCNFGPFYDRSLFGSIVSSPPATGTQSYLRSCACRSRV